MKPAGDAGDEDDDDETCGFCRFMKAGGCKKEFTVGVLTWHVPVL